MELCNRRVPLAVAFVIALTSACEGGADPSAIHPVAARPTPPARAEKHLLLVVESSSEGLRIVSARTAPGAVPQRRGEPSRRWRVSVEGAADPVLHETSVADPMVLRAEWVEPDGALAGKVIALDRSTFTVRVPHMPDARRLRIHKPSSIAHNTEDLGVLSLPEVEQ